jgi:hypothetical protein
MARDPNERRSSSIIETATDVPSGAVLPPVVKQAGIGTGTGQYYGYRVIYANGRSEIEWYKRGSGGGPDQPDPVELRSEAPPAADVKDAWDKEEAKPPPAPATRNINGVPHQVTGKDENGQDIWSPVQTATGPAQAGASAATPKPTKIAVEGTPDPSKPGGFDNERPVMASYWPDGRVTYEPLTPAERKDWDEQRQQSRNPGGKTDAQLAADAKAADDKARQQAADARAVAAANKPGAPTLKPDGKGGTIAIQVMPDGTIKETPLPGVPSEATRVTVEGVVYEKGPDGKFAPAAGIPLPGATAKNVEPFVPDPSQPDLGLGAWAAAQRAKIGQPSEAGGITQSEYDQAVKAGHDQATVYIQNVTSSQTVRRQAEQDERGQRKDLSEQSAGDYGRAQGIFSEILQYTKPGSRAIMDVIPGIMAEQARFRQQREQTARAAPPLHPMFQVMPQAAGVAPAAAPAAPLPPEQAAAVGPPPEIPMTPERVQGIMQNPVFRPQPMVAAPAAPPPLGQGQDLSTPVSMAPPEPGMVSAWAGPMVAPPQPAPVAGQPVLALPQPQPAPVFDPMQTAGKLAQWGVPAEVVAQAMAEMGVG